MGSATGGGTRHPALCCGLRYRRALLLLLSLALAGTAGCSDGGDGPGASIDVGVANLNILHGFDCDPPVPGDGDQCRVRERVALLAQHLVDSDCPDLVTLQEVLNREYVQRSPTEQAGPLDSIVSLIEAELPALATDCGFRYHLVYQPFLPQAVFETDEELVLSRYPVLHAAVQPLHSALYDEPNGYLLFARHVLHVQVDHPLGIVDVYTTHLASGSDAASNNCNSFRELVPGTGIGPRVSCPAECDAADTVRACQAEQLARYVEQTRETGGLALISGDFNAVPGSSEYLAMTRRGWLDTLLTAGGAECDPATGENCTSGRDSSAAAIDSPTPAVDRRIDYIFAALPGDGADCRVTRGDMFAARANAFNGACGPPPAPPCWVSDHSGNLAVVSCTP